jgi:hypothetical protein
MIWTKGRSARGMIWRNTTDNYARWRGVFNLNYFDWLPGWFEVELLLQLAAPNEELDVVSFSAWGTIIHCLHDGDGSYRGS